MTAATTCLGRAGLQWSPAVTAARSWTAPAARRRKEEEGGRSTAHCNEEMRQRNVFSPNTLRTDTTETRQPP